MKLVVKQNKISGQKKKNPFSIKEKKSKASLFSDDMVLYIKDSEDLTREQNQGNSHTQNSPKLQTKKGKDLHNEILKQ